VLSASERHDIPFYVETHRATITQDMWRTVQWVTKFPELRFNGDFSHWYTGQEMWNGGIERKWEFLAPVFERVRFLHGRIGTAGAIQVDVGDGGNGVHVDHFREMWTRAFAGFLKSATPGDYIVFSPELLEPAIWYARTITDADGTEREECDRWEQSRVLTRIAQECFDAAKQRLEEE